MNSALAALLICSLILYTQGTVTHTPPGLTSQGLREHLYYASITPFLLFYFYYCYLLLMQDCITCNFDLFLRISLLRRSFSNPTTFFFFFYRKSTWVSSEEPILTRTPAFWLSERDSYFIHIYFTRHNWIQSFVTETKTSWEQLIQMFLMWVKFHQMFVMKIATWIKLWRELNWALCFPLAGQPLNGSSRCLCKNGFVKTPARFLRLMTEVKVYFPSNSCPQTEITWVYIYIYLYIKTFWRSFQNSFVQCCWFFSLTCFHLFLLPEWKWKVRLTAWIQHLALEKWCCRKNSSK